MIDKAKTLLNKNWPKEQHDIIKRLVDNLVAYKLFFPNALRDDVTAILDIAIHIKDDYELLKSKETCDTKETYDTKETSQQTTEVEMENNLNKNLPQPFSLIVNETGTIIFTVKSNSDIMNELNDELKDKLKEELKEELKDTEIIERESSTIQSLEKKKKKFRWKNLFCL